MRTTRLAGDTVGAVLIGPSSPQILACHGYNGNPGLEDHDWLDRPAARGSSLERIRASQERKHIDHGAVKYLAAIEPGRSVVIAKILVVAKDIGSSLANQPLHALER